MPKGVRRSEEERGTAVALAGIVGQETAADSMGLPLSTVHSWVKKDQESLPNPLTESTECSEKTREMQTVYVQKAWELANRYLDSLIKSVPPGGVQSARDMKDMATALGIITEKALLVSGRATRITESGAGSSQMTPEQMKEAARLALQESEQERRNRVKPVK